MIKLLLKLLTVIPKKIASFIIFPFIYPFRNSIARAKHADNDIWAIPFIKHKNKGWKLFVWFFLDDSIYDECGKEYSTNRKNIYWLTHNDFLNSWYWNGIRNTSCNFSHYIAKGRMIRIIRTYNTKLYSYEVREFSKGTYPYLEVYVGKYVLNVGWFHSGKFEGIKVRRGLH